MFAIGETVIVKNLDVLLKEKALCPMDGVNGLYVDHNTHYAVFSDFNFFNIECTITDIDANDDDIPYFLSCGIWVPAFMITKKPMPKKEEVELVLEEEEPKKEEVKQYVNQFNGKPFSKLFLKLIALDEKIAEFSGTKFSKLKKHELLYIAKLLKEHGALDLDYNILNQKELATVCYSATKNL